MLILECIEVVHPVDEKAAAKPVKSKAEQPYKTFVHIAGISTKAKHALKKCELFEKMGACTPHITQWSVIIARRAEPK